ncbi:MAG: hypothetical protein AB1705_16295 [Verrucomicrobiota bacterium]
MNIKNRPLTRFLIKNGLTDPESHAAFFGLLQNAERIGDKGLGLAGYLELSGKERVLALALNPNSPDWVIRHELHHFAREAVFMTKHGRSLFMEEVNTRAALP